MRWVLAVCGGTVKRWGDCGLGQCGAARAALFHGRVMELRCRWLFCSCLLWSSSLRRSRRRASQNALARIARSPSISPRLCNPIERNIWRIHLPMPTWMFIDGEEEQWQAYDKPTMPTLINCMHEASLSHSNQSVSRSVSWSSASHSISPCQSSTNQPIQHSFSQDCQQGSNMGRAPEQLAGSS